MNNETEAELEEQKQCTRVALKMFRKKCEENERLRDALRELIEEAQQFSSKADSTRDGWISMCLLENKINNAQLLLVEK